MRVACCITKAADTHPEYVIRIVFPRQQWLRERALVLRFCVHPLSCSVPCWCCDIVTIAVSA